MRVGHFIGRLASVVILAIVPAVRAASQPNVVIFLSDDQGWGDLSHSGNTNLSTPNVDSLARDGVSFDRFYVCPLCAPTRAEFLTGRYHPRTGVAGVSTGRERLNPDERTIADVFRAAGYATGCFGKWHNGTQWPYHPRARGFDEFYGITHGHWGWYFNPPLDQNGQHAQGTGYVADDFTTHAIQFIESNKDRPFLCYLPFNTPHSPFAVPDEYWRRFKDRPITLRGTPAGRRQENLDETRCALAMVENLDHNVGRVLKRLDELKLADNTIVLFFCDNGPNGARFNGGMKGIKGSTDEGGVRSPLFIRWPDHLKPGRTVEPIAAAIDLLPTLAALAHVPLPPKSDRPLDGVDLTPVLFSPDAPWPGRAIFSHNAGRTSVRTQRYRLDDSGALFDMLADPGQTKDVAKDKPAVAATLTKVVADWRKDVLGDKSAGDTRPFPVGHRDAPLTMLPARDAVHHGNIRRSSNAPNCSYFINWTAPTDSITWDIEVLEPGLYEATAYYTCPEAGSTVELSFGDAKLSAAITPAWDPPLATDQDTISRPAGESKMKDFRPLPLGRIRLDISRGPLTLRATAIPGRSVMDLFQLDLRRVTE